MRRVALLVSELLLGGVWGVVGNAQREPQSFAQTDEILLESQGADGVGSTSIEGQQDFWSIAIALRELQFPSKGNGVADERAALP